MPFFVCIFPNISSFAKKLGGGSEAVSEYLLREAGIATVPGKPFGDDSRIRLSFAQGVNQLEKAFDRVSIALQKL